MRKVERVKFSCFNCGNAVFKLKSQHKGNRVFCSKSCWYNTRTSKSIEESFWERVNKTNSCWIWTGQAPNGYGRIDRSTGSYSSHRVSWELHFGRVPEGMHVLHKCDNPLCVNPEHLFLGSQVDNNTDKISKSRQAKGEDFPHAKLTEEKVREIREMTKQGYSQVELAQIHKIDNSRICAIVNGNSWRHVK